MAIKNIIYDFDGTIADSWEEGIAIFNEIAARRGYNTITGENKEILRAQGWREVCKHLGIPLLMLPFVVNEARKRISTRLSEVQPFPHISEVIALLHTRGYTQAIVTSNDTTGVTEFVRAHQLSEYVQCVEGNCSLFNKARKIKRLMRAQRMVPAETIYVGDEIRDIEAARKAGIRIVSVTWGANTEAVLRAHAPDYVVTSPKELVQMFSD
jgi:phosphoglycolate phosphatase